ncbi:BZ3500_MvSof-1268-A1-R1_Chr2-1g04553 [Microbotryum saponariae]|uniref:BZ3500_MvSof-1268-A1-R1_Chr2-1g04553 protein n=1 Tax=Microbotryum saponariae TaxID=289078 RepID=A0A2X0KB80_9BASI|nr:BZ3500_MvSof-1268-A1-R1_Chr2-1g04553 [Microbotryum saponariae]SCZ92006.1 BZ3501_MvSof-1269-A2-R1_Chr2-1g04209 [Microbotryum saponariae]
MTHSCLSTTPLATLALLLPLITPARAQYGYYYGNGRPYGQRIGIVGVAVAVMLVILVISFLLRRRRARAFKQAYPVQAYQPNQVQGQPSASNNNGTFETGQQGQQQQGYQTQPFHQPPPGYSNYRADQSTYPQPHQPQYAPPTSLPPAANPSSHYAPPSGPPPTGK